MKHDISKYLTDIKAIKNIKEQFTSDVEFNLNLLSSYTYSKNHPINSYTVKTVEFNERNNTTENKYEEARQKMLKIKKKREELELLELEYSLLVKKLNQKVKRKRIL